MSERKTWDLDIAIAQKFFKLTIYRKSQFVHMRPEEPDPWLIVRDGFPSDGTKLPNYSRDLSSALLAAKQIDYKVIAFEKVGEEDIICTLKDNRGGYYSAKGVCEAEALCLALMKFSYKRSGNNPEL